MLVIPRIYAGPDGESHLDEMEFRMEALPGGSWQSESIMTTDIVFRGKERFHESGFHCIPHKQLVILLAGELEIETSDGARRRFNPGEMFLCEDATGKGHKVRGMNRKLAMLRFA
jgi:hypothetical protein